MTKTPEDVITKDSPFYNAQYLEKLSDIRLIGTVSTGIITTVGLSGVINSIVQGNYGWGIIIFGFFTLLGTPLFIERIRSFRGTRALAKQARADEAAAFEAEMARIEEQRNRQNRPWWKRG